jgi:hypothetical protein
VSNLPPHWYSYQAALRRRGLHCCRLCRKVKPLSRFASSAYTRETKQGVKTYLRYQDRCRNCAAEYALLRWNAHGRQRRLDRRAGRDMADGSFY